ncbi:MAG: Fic family protein [Akkermansia sp.]|nr:Fic family protein [Akkermansia sp.]
MMYSDFYEQYLYAEEPDTCERALTWDISIGLQAVDGLEVSEYLKEVSREHIEGYISMPEVQQRIASYYAEHKEQNGKSADEADKVAANIAAILNEPTFLFSPAGFAGIHRKLFHNVFKFAGKIRDYNITKKEWVLGGDTVQYAHFSDLIMALDYDIEKEKRFSYKGLSKEEKVSHIAHFIADIWQIHPFPEGNTRTTAVFCIKYLRYLGFKVSNQLFARKARYFRDALVRANYSNIEKGVSADDSFLLRFFKMLLLGEYLELHSRDVHIHAAPLEQKTVTPSSVEPVSHPAPIDDSSVFALLKAMGGDTVSIREMMLRLHLKGRDNFLKNYFTPALSAGYILPLYPDTPRHPRQKYLLSDTGRKVLKKRKGKQ